MSRSYERKTDRRSREERKLSVRAEHRDQPNVELLSQLLICFAIQDAGERGGATPGMSARTPANSRSRS